MLASFEGNLNEKPTRLLASLRRFRIRHVLHWRSKCHPKRPILSEYSFRNANSASATRRDSCSKKQDFSRRQSLRAFAFGEGFSPLSLLRGEGTGERGLEAVKSNPTPGPSSPTPKRGGEKYIVCWRSPRYVRRDTIDRSMHSIKRPTRRAP